MILHVGAKNKPADGGCRPPCDGRLLPTTGRLNEAGGGFQKKRLRRLHLKLCHCALVSTHMLFQPQPCPSLPSGPTGAQTLLHTDQPT